MFAATTQRKATQRVGPASGYPVQVEEIQETVRAMADVSSGAVRRKPMNEFLATSAERRAEQPAKAQAEAPSPAGRAKKGGASKPAKPHA